MKRWMKRKDVFESLKLLNQICDQIKKYKEGTPEYEDADDAIYGLADMLCEGSGTWYSFHYSKKTGHYYIKCE